MLSLPRAFETLALTLPRFDSIEHAATAIALVYQGEVEMLPISRAIRTAKLSADQLKKLTVLVIRDLQDWGRKILVEKGLGHDDDLWGVERAFAPGHAKIIQDAWDALGEAPVWRVFERQFEALQ
ncbi:MAG TPA: hypothetical protein VLE97_11110 [Gaiellaceae bacterium]|nr:hypothetical protein [Gaiellaceae bacterium]